MRHDTELSLELICFGSLEEVLYLCKALKVKKLRKLANAGFPGFAKSLRKIFALHKTLNIRHL